MPSQFKTIVLLKSGVDGKRRGQGVCKGCGRRIWWCTTAAGKAIPFDVDPDVIEADERTELVSTERTHWASCPERARFKRRTA